MDETSFHLSAGVLFNQNRLTGTANGTGNIILDRAGTLNVNGYNMMDFLAGRGEDPRKEFFYWTDDGNLAAVRYERWKLLFLEQRAVGFKVWSEPLVPLRVPLIEDLRADPFERAVDEAEGYGNYILNHAFLAVPCQAFEGKHLQTYLAYPPRQKAGSFTLDKALEKLQEAGNSGKH